MRLVKLSILMSSLLLSAFLLLSILSLSRIPAASRGGGAGILGVLKGDVNCDGELDISDPIRLLQHIFQGGPEPCAFAAEPLSVSPGWPLRGENIVNIHRGELVQASSMNTIFTVPEDRWLVVTHFWIVPRVDLLEVLGDEVTEKFLEANIAPFSVATVGLTFRPGSQVVLRNNDNTPGTNTQGRVFIIGYLSD